MLLFSGVHGEGGAVDMGVGGGGGDKTWSEQQVQELESKMAAMEQKYQARIARLEEEMAEGKAMLQHLVNSLLFAHLVSGNSQAAPHTHAPEDVGAEGAGGVVTVTLAQMVEEVTALHAKCVEGLKTENASLVAAVDRLELKMCEERLQTSNQMRRLQNEYAIELDVLQGALEQGADRIASLAITDSHLARGHTGSPRYGHAGSPRTLPSPHSTPRLDTPTHRANSSSTNSTPRFQGSVPRVGEAVGEAREGVDGDLVLASPWGRGEGGGGWRDLSGVREAVEEGLQEEEEAGIAGYMMDASSPLEVCAMCEYTWRT